MQKPQPRENASTDFCGSGWNRTYTFSFVGPGYKCDDVDDIGTNGADAPFTSDDFAPKGNLVYAAEIDRADFGNQNPIRDKEFLGIFESEPDLWIGYSVNMSKPYSDEEPDYRTKWGNVHQSKLFKCVLHYTKYRFNMSYNSRQPATR